MWKCYSYWLELSVAGASKWINMPLKWARNFNCGNYSFHLSSHYRWLGREGLCRDVDVKCINFLWMPAEYFLINKHSKEEYQRLGILPKLIRYCCKVLPEGHHHIIIMSISLPSMTFDILPRNVVESWKLITV